MSYPQLQQQLARDLNCLKDPDRFKRKSGLDALQRELFTKVSASPHAQQFAVKKLLH